MTETYQLTVHSGVEVSLDFAVEFNPDAVEGTKYSLMTLWVALDTVHDERLNEIQEWALKALEDETIELERQVNSLFSEYSDDVLSLERVCVDHERVLRAIKILSSQTGQVVQ